MSAYSSVSTIMAAYQRANIPQKVRGIPALEPSDTSRLAPSSKTVKQLTSGHRRSNFESENGVEQGKRISIALPGKPHEQGGSRKSYTGGDVKHRVNTDIII